MSNSSLICFKEISPNKNAPRNHKIDTLSIHCMAGDMSIEACGSWMSRSSTKASSNYGIGTDGRIGMYVEESDRSWCTSSSSNDNRSVTIEVANDGGAPDWHVSDKAFDSLVKLCADICRRNGIKQLLWKSDKSLIGHITKQNMTVHRWFKDKACPGNYLYGKHMQIAKEVNALLSVPYDAKDYSVPGGSTTTALPVISIGSSPDINTRIDAKSFTPFVATLSPTTTYVDCKKLKKAMVCGLMLYGGCYYDVVHRPNTYYRATHLKQQVNCAYDGNMPFALYVNVKAHSVNEAELECKALWYIVSKYPPKLGLWLKLTTSQSVITNNSILEVYYKYIERWGMKDLCGIYATRKDLESFTWDKFYERFSLWLVDHVDSMTDITGQLLTPDLFLLKEV